MTGRRAVFLTARRELRERARSRAFLISTIAQVLIVLAIVLISSLTGDDTELFEVGTVGEGPAAVARAAQTQEDAFAVELEVSSFDDEEVARSAVEEDDIDAAITDEAVITRAGPSETLVALIQQASRSVEGANSLKPQGLSEEEITTALEPEPLEVDKVGEESGSGVAYISSLLLYVAIIASGYAVATGVVEEKSSRVVEVILSAIKPVHLLAGKVAGIGLLSLGQLLVIVLAGLTAAIPAGALDLPDSTVATIALIAVYFILGYVLYACAFAVAGALVSRQEDVQSSSGPLTLVLIVAYLVAISAAESPEGTLAVVATFIPLFAPMIVPARAAQDALPLGELALSLVLMLLAVALLLWVAARVYDRTVLRMGAPMKLRDAFRIARSG
jgi:ABC-2 type transport system permease protein